MKHKRILPLPGTGDDGCPQFAILNSKDAWEVTSCDWALKFVDMGLNFFGELEIALALDEVEAKKDFEVGASAEDWMPVSPDMINVDEITNNKQEG